MIMAALWAVAGALAASGLACIPGLHIYNVLAMILPVVLLRAGDNPVALAEVIFPLSGGLVVGFAMANTIPSVLLSAPDESAVFTVLPGQKYLMEGRGYEGVMITAGGGLLGLAALALIAGPLAPRFIPAAQDVLMPHAHWILWCVIAFMLLSEWPKGSRLGGAGWSMFLDGWKTTGAGLLTFGLAGLLGFVLFHGTPVRIEAAYQNLMPAFTGLFTLPALLVSLLCPVEVPPQTHAVARLKGAPLMQGALAGCLGGGLAALLPGVTGGVGGMLAGHASAIRDDRIFLASQGASKVVYYVGGLLLFVVPGGAVTRGGASWMLRPLIEPLGHHEYYLLLGTLALAGAVAYGVMSPLTRLALRLSRRFSCRQISLPALVGAVGLVAWLTGWGGLAVMLVGCGIGLIPILMGSRRMNCLAVILVPLACGLSGVGDRVATWLGLV